LSSPDDLQAIAFFLPASKNLESDHPHRSYRPFPLFRLPSAEFIFLKHLIINKLKVFSKISMDLPTLAFKPAYNLIEEIFGKVEI